MDLMGPMQVESIAGKRYIFVCVDDFFRFTSMNFKRKKSDTFESFRNLCIKFKNEKNYNIDRIVRIKSNRGKEFENSIFFFFLQQVWNFSRIFLPQDITTKWCCWKEKLYVVGNSSDPLERVWFIDMSKFNSINWSLPTN